MKIDDIFRIATNSLLGTTARSQTSTALKETVSAGAADSRILRRTRGFTAASDVDRSENEVER